MNLSIRINPKYASLQQYIATIPSRLETEGDTIHNGRNLIKVLTAPDGTLLNVKRYHRPSFFNRLVYSIGIRKPKGLRAYEYPKLLLDAGINTPEAVAYIEERTCGMLGFSYFISTQCKFERRFYEIVDDSPDIYVPLAKAFAKFTAHMHEAHFLHRDYSPGNILWQQSADGGYDFSVVDINRMYFGEVTLKQGCTNFARLWGSKLFFQTLAQTYAKERGMDEAQCLRVVMDERRRFWERYSKKHKISFKLDL